VAEAAPWLLAQNLLALQDHSTVKSMVKQYGKAAPALYISLSNKKSSIKDMSTESPTDPDKPVAKPLTLNPV